MTLQLITMKAIKYRLCGKQSDTVVSVKTAEKKLVKTHATNSWEMKCQGCLDELHGGHLKDVYNDIIPRFEIGGDRDDANCVGEASSFSPASHYHNLITCNKRKKASNKSKFHYVCGFPSLSAEFQIKHQDIKTPPQIIRKNLFSNTYSCFPSFR